MINPNPTAPDLTYTVDGAVYSPDRAGVSRLQVSLVDKNTGPDVLLAQAVTDSRGRYRISVLITGASLAARHKASRICRRASPPLASSSAPPRSTTTPPSTKP